MPIKACLIFAHRGANTEAMENTQQAFDSALKYAIDGIETDVQLSHDDITVLWHDQTLEKLGVADKRIDDFDCQTLQTISAAAFDNQGIMTLQAFMAAYQSRCHLLLEVKNRDWEPSSRHQIKIRQTLDLIGSNPDQRHFISSFHLESLVFAHHCKTNTPIIYNLTLEQTPSDLQQVLTQHPFLHGLCLPIETLQQDTIDLLHQRNKLVAVYTCNSDQEIQQALTWGVDILISDYPQKALMLRDS